ncbi:MAG: urea ABC transporter ATP-binding subunit UrtE [Proteobacteria bacterium]|nr:urea ABC transporter ATP-binding subunit UrtE [Pseudomonadota bacterium]
MLKISHLEQFYGGSHILRGVNLEINSGRVGVLLGRNGVGKTTLLKTVMGLTPAKSGSLFLDGQDITAMPTYQRARLGIGYVPQGREIFNRLTVEENLLMGLASAKTATERRIPTFIYELFPVLKKMLNRRGGDLSGGQQQQLAIGRAIVSDPRVLLLDEPTEGIQPSIIKEIGEVIKQLAHQKNMAVLLVEQYYDFAQLLADDYAVMSRGQIQDSGLGSEMMQKNVQALVSI